MIYLQLFWSFFQVGLFSFGGGYAAMPLIQQQVVQHYSWLSMPEFTDLITISQMTPGPIAINSATFVGMRIAGFGGALIATLGCILPSCIIVGALAFLYFRYRGIPVIQDVLEGLRPAVVALIAAAGITIAVSAFWSSGGISLTNTDWKSMLLFVAAFVVLRIKKWDPIFIMVGTGAIGGIIYFMR